MTEDEAVDCSSAKDTFAGFDAEAVLLAIAEPLNWLDLSAANPSTFNARIGSARYGYGPVRDKPLFFAVHCPDIANLRNNLVSREYATIAEAKAACERHHATGKWE